MQAVKYAAMASRFNLEALAAAHAAFKRSRGAAISEDQAAEALQAHAAGLTNETLHDPRIVVVAQGFSPLVISAVVWLADRADRRELPALQARSGEVLVTFSTLFPLPDLERSLISPGEAAAERAHEQVALGGVVDQDLVRLGQIANLTTRSTLDLCSEQPGIPVSLTQIVSAAGVTRYEARAQLAGLTIVVKGRFGRRNWPFSVKWDVDGSGQAFYVIADDVAERWHEAVVELDGEQSDADVASSTRSAVSAPEDEVVLFDDK